MAKAKAGPVVSDNGNFIIDAPFPEELMRDPYTVRATASARSPDALSPRPNQSLSAQVRTRRRVNW